MFTHVTIIEKNYGENEHAVLKSSALYLPCSGILRSVDL